MVTALFLVAISHAIRVASAGSNPAGAAYLEHNAQASGVTELDSGLQYKVLVSGNETAHPTVGSLCAVAYVGTFIDGKVFDSS